tara:strand:+ start:16193 stop:16801 length:609 start_codon:yes stop_codon:yes gene_type:complete
MKKLPSDLLREHFAKTFFDEPLPDNLRPSAVVLPILFRENQIYIVFNKRSQFVEFHKGEICFPGGGKDDSDVDLTQTALRETKEEMGIDTDSINLIGTMTPTVTRTGFAIKPYVGIIPDNYPYKPFIREVEEIIEVPISHLLNSENIRIETTLTINGLETTFSYKYDSHLIYGATARILSQFLEQLEIIFDLEDTWIYTRNA